MKNLNRILSVILDFQLVAAAACEQSNDHAENQNQGKQPIHVFHNFLLFHFRFYNPPD